MFKSCVFDAAVIFPKSTLIEKICWLTGFSILKPIEESKIWVYVLWLCCIICIHLLIKMFWLIENSLFYKVGVEYMLKCSTQFGLLNYIYIYIYIYIVLCCNSTQTLSFSEEQVHFSLCLSLSSSSAASHYSLMLASPFAKSHLLFTLGATWLMVPVELEWHETLWHLLFWHPLSQRWLAGRGDNTYPC